MLAAMENCLPMSASAQSGVEAGEIERLFRRIDAARDDLVTLTRDLIRFPTINPPGDAYEACARFLGDRLAATLPGAELVRLEGLGHYPMLEDPIRTGRALGAWLDEIAPASAAA